MRTALLRIGFLVLPLLAALAPGGVTAAAEKSARELLPASTVVYLEVPEPAKLLDLVLQHPLTQQLAVVPEYRQVLAQRDVQRLEAVLKQFETRLGVDRRQLASSLMSGGVYVGFDLPTQGVVALAQANSEKLAEQARDAVIEIIRADAAAKGKHDPVKEDVLRGVKILQVDKLFLATLGKWLLVTNKELLASMVLANYLDNGGDTLASKTHFQTVLAGRSGQPAAWVYADLRILRQLGALAAAAKKKGNNPLAELIAGGVVGLLPEASYATATLDLDAAHLKLSATLPGDPEQIAKPREFYFARAEGGGAPPLLTPPGAMLSLATYRDLGSFWRHAPDLFDERVNSKMAEAEGNLTTFFAGRNFRDDILGNLAPQIQLVVARQEFLPGTITPAIKLPAVGVVLRMKQPETTARIFKVTFQSFVGFLNVVGGMKKVDPLELNTERLGDALVVSTQYFPAPQAEAAAQRGEGALHFNASPTAVFAGDLFILASARSLAIQLAEAAQRPAPPPSGVNTRLMVDGQVGRQALADNRDVLISQSMLTKGHDRPAAAKEIDGLLSLLSHLQGSAVSLITKDQQLRFTWELSLADHP